MSLQAPESAPDAAGGLRALWGAWRREGVEVSRDALIRALSHTAEQARAQLGRRLPEAARRRWSGALRRAEARLERLACGEAPWAVLAG